MRVHPLARSRVARILASLAICAPALAAAVIVPARASAQPPLQLGVYLPGAPGNGSVLDGYASMVGRKPDIVMMYRSLEGPLLYSNEIANLRERSETPLVTLEPYAEGGMASFPEIAAGKYDSYFRREADAAKALGMTVLLRFAHEMNLPSMAWGPGKAGNTGASYVEAWRHIVTIFRQEGADNVKWVWAPNVDYGGRPFSQYFPGDEWVDYVGLDGYNWGTSEGGSWQSFAEVFGSSYATITQLSSKPVIITETASSETGGSKAAWIEEAFLRTVPQQMPRVQAVVWFDATKERDWPIDTSQSSLNAYRNVVASTLYGGTQAPPAESAAPVEEPAPVVEELKVVPKSHKHGRAIKVSGRISYRLSRKATVLIALRRRHSRAKPFFFVAEQNPGHRRVSLKKLVHRRCLHRGEYQISVVAISRTGTRSQPRQRGIRIAVRGKGGRHRVAKPGRRR